MTVCIILNNALWCMQPDMSNYYKKIDSWGQFCKTVRSQTLHQYILTMPVYSVNIRENRTVTWLPHHVKNESIVMASITTQTKYILALENLNQIRAHWAVHIGSMQNGCFNCWQFPNMKLIAIKQNTEMSEK